MSTTFPNKKTVEWVVGTFRPLMQGLKIKDLADMDDVHQLNTFDDPYYDDMQKSHIDSCILIVKRTKLPKSSDKGIFVWQYNEETGLFALYIFLNDSMYTSTAKNAQEIRKLVSTHEFTHCVAAMLSVSEMTTASLIQNQRKKMGESFHSLQENDVPKIQNDIILSMYAKSVTTKNMFNFPDSHFRTGDEDFQGSYLELYSFLLFSYELFRENFDDAAVKNYYKAKLKDKKKADGIISVTADKIAKKKCLPKTFVKLRIRDFFLERAMRETFRA